MKTRIVFAAIITMVFAFLVSTVPVSAEPGDPFTGTLCRNDDFSGTPITVLPSGRLLSQGGFADWMVTSSDPRVAGEMESYNMVFNVEGGFYPGQTLEGNAHAHFTIYPTAGGGTWEGVFECLYRLEDGINYHTFILNGHGTGGFQGMVIKIKQTHEFPFAASMSCYWPEAEPWPFNGHIK